MTPLLIIVAVLFLCGAAKFGMISALIAGMILGAVLTRMFK